MKLYERVSAFIDWSWEGSIWRLYGCILAFAAVIWAISLIIVFSAIFVGIVFLGIGSGS